MCKKVSTAPHPRLTVPDPDPDLPRQSLLKLAPLIKYKSILLGVCINYQHLIFCLALPITIKMERRIRIKALQIRKSDPMTNFFLLQRGEGILRPLQTVRRAGGSGYSYAGLRHATLPQARS
jgi:hypothetical protein